MALVVLAVILTSNLSAQQSDKRADAEIERLRALALPLEHEGRYQEALAIRQQILASAEHTLGAQNPAIPEFLVAVAKLLDVLEHYAEAEQLYRKAISIHESAFGPSNPVLANDLIPLAGLLRVTGRYGEAESMYRRALQFEESAGSAGRDQRLLARACEGLGRLLKETNRLEEAERFYRRALAIDEQTFGPDSPNTATDLYLLAQLQLARHRYEEAESLNKRVLSIRERAFGPNNLSVARTCSDLADVYVNTGRFAEAEPLYVRAIAILEQVKGVDNAEASRIRRTLAIVLDKTGRQNEALALLQRAYRNARGSDRVWKIEKDLMRAYQNANPSQPTLAIFYGKEAVNSLQQLRGNLNGSGKEAEDAFSDAVAPVYRKLADLLIRNGRTAEAQQVLAMLKEQEFFDFTDHADADAPKTVASLNASEKELDDLNAQIVSQGKEMGSLQEKYAKDGQLSPAEHDRLEALRKAMDAAQATFDARATAVANSAADPEAQKRRQQQIDDYSRAFRGTLKELGRGAVVAQYFMLDDHVDILLTTPDAVVEQQSPIKREELTRQIFAFRNTLSSPDRDPLPQAKALYQLLVQPIAAELRAAGAKTLMLSLDDTLRYLPFAALHDGKSYLIENLSIVMETEAVRDKLAKQPKDNWTVWGMGVTKGGADYPALPNVAVELNDITGSKGILNGKIFLDKDFTESSLRDGLDQGYPIIHIASHFAFEPGSMDDSFLLLGDGSRLSLGQIKTKLNFGGVELLTLSACETALGDTGAEHRGVEVESLGALAQEAGAKAVLATLWPVADDSTALLMRDLYQAHKEYHLTKGEALRHAQLALLRGTAQSDAATKERRGLTREDATQPVGNFKADPRAPFAHPFYWAPFILMGNWL
jgi:CHAT domain-containing protein/tetratricopeptide (TPR) repeat protein